MNDEGSKRCTKCGKVLPLHQFYSDSNSKGGYRAQCKRCSAELRDKVYFGKRNKDVTIPEGCKRCPHCERILLKTGFGICRSKPDGLQSWCNDCRQARRDAHRKPKEQIPEGTKRCYKCKQLLPATLEFFSADKRSPGGLQAACKQCFNTYREKNRDRILAQKHEHYLLNGKAYWRIAGERRRSRKLELPDEWNVEYWKLCLTYWNNECCICGERQHLQADHWIPLVNPACPGTIPENMIVLCRACNFQKHAKLPEIWLTKKLGGEAAERKLAEIQAYFAYVSDLRKEG
jgi:hypothetical protein